ncbi:MAG: hypothetical protein ACYSTS_18895, partial [Planctomycetota bacterium]
TIKDHELLIYICKDQMDSVVSTFFSNPRPGPGGSTAWNNTVTGSEVYVSGCRSDANFVANMAFHEALHNKGHWNDRRLHGSFGGGGLASDTITATTALSATNIR